MAFLSNDLLISDEVFLTPDCQNLNAQRFDHKPVSFCISSSAWCYYQIFRTKNVLRQDKIRLKIFTEIS